MSPEYIPRQINKNNILSYCDSKKVNPQEHWVLRKFLDRSSSYFSKNIIGTVEVKNNTPHHILILTTSDLLQKYVPAIDAQLLNALLDKVPTYTMLDYVFGKRVSNNQGVADLRGLLADGDLNEKELKGTMKSLYIEPIKRGDIHLAFSEDEDNFEDLIMNLSPIGRVVGYRSGLSRNFVNDLITSLAD